MSARIQTCNWRLNRRPEVRRFIIHDLPSFHNVEFKQTHGKSPELLLLDEDEQPVEVIELSDLSHQECNDLLIRKGFYKKKHRALEVPDEYKTGPYTEKVEELPEDTKDEVEELPEDTKDEVDSGDIKHTEL